MFRKIFYLFIFIFFLCLKCFSQNTVWDYKQRLFVEQKQNMYVLELFHHKVEMTIDTLLLVNNSTYIGNIYTLINDNGELYIQSNNGREKLKLKVSTNDAVKKRNRKHNFIYYRPYEIKISKYGGLLRKNNKYEYLIFDGYRMEMYKKIDEFSIENFKCYFDIFIKKYNLR